MKCSSCIGGGRRSLSSSDHESSSPLSSPVKKGNQLEQSMATNNEKPRGSEDSSTSRPPSITIEELDDEVFDNTKEEELHRHMQRYAQELNDFEDFSYQLASPLVVRLEVIREEDSGDACSDCSDNENPKPRDDPTPLSPNKVKQFSPAKMLRDLLRYRRGRSKQRHFERQEPTTCLLVGAKESTMIPTEYRSVCTTETVDCEKLEVELVNVGSNSSSMDDLSDIDEGASVLEVSQHLNSLQFNDDFQFLNLDTVALTDEADHVQTLTKSLNQAQVNHISITEIDNDRDSTSRESHHATHSSMVEQQITESNTASSNDQQTCAYASARKSHEEDRQPKTGRSSPEVGVPGAPHHTPPRGTSSSILRSTPNERFEEDVVGVCDHTNDERTAEDSLVVTDDEKMLARTMLEGNRARAELSSSEPVATVRDRVLSAKDVKENVTELFSACSSAPDIVRADSYPFGVPSVPQVDSSIVVNHWCRNEDPCFGKIMTIDNGVDTDIEGENCGVAGTLCTSSSPLVAEGTPLPQNPLAKEKTNVEACATPSDSDVVNVTNLAHSADQISGPPVPPPLPPPPAAVLLPVTVEALSAPSVSVLAASNDGQIHSGDHSRKADHADADTNSTQDSVPAVVSPAVTVEDQSVLLKYIQEDIASTGETEGEASSSNSRNSRKKSTEESAGKRKPIAIPRSNSGDPGKNNGDHGPKIERSHAGSGSSGQYFMHGGLEAAAPHIQTMVDLSQKAASGMIEVGVVHAPVIDEGARSVDLRSEVTRLKDQELQDEFRKLELETARYEQELQQMSLPSISSNSYRNEHVASAIEQHRTVSVSKESRIQLQSSSSSNTVMTTDVKMRNGSTVPVPLPNRDINNGNNQLYHEWQNTMKNREARLVQRSASSLHDQNATTCNLVTMTPPMVPPPPNVEEEHVTMKVKDRVREFMASEAAKSESRPMIRGNGMSSAPATPTASRKHIEAEFQQFREIRAQEQQRGLIGGNSAAKENGKAPNGLPSQPIGNDSPSRIPLPIGKLSSSSTKNGIQSTSEQGDDSVEVKVNVAALIATHQEKQQLQKSSSFTSSNVPVKCKPKNIGVIAAAPKDLVPIGVAKPSLPDEATETAVISVSDKCQQFEHRIRQNSIGNEEVQQTRQRQQLKGTVNASVHHDACDAGREGLCFSEADLLHEIDHALVLAKDFLFSRGVWSPYNRSTEVLTKEELAERTSNSKASEPLQQVWVPRSAPPSPAPERREFRPIGYESPTPSRRALASPSPAAVAAPWTQPGYSPPLAVSESKLNPSSNASSSIRCGISTSTPPQPQGHGQQVRFAPQPRSAADTLQQEPTINSLLKSKDGKAAVVGDAEMAADRQTSATTVTKRTTSSSQQQQLGGSSNRIVSPAPRTGYSSSEMQHEGVQSQMMQQTVHKVAGIGPTTREGMPLTLRSEIDEGNRDKWYKQMYQTLHKAHDDDDYVTVRYKTRRGYPYKSSGYQSEPEPNYDSDYTIKYSTLDRRRTPIGLSPTSYNKFNTQQQTTQHNQPIKSGSTSYKNHPGRIENYTPGRSSISEKESKAWWDEVMDIFNGQLEHQKLTTSKTYTEGNLSRALKEQGYESDSTLVFRKREPVASAALSPVEQKQYYKTMQAGGEIPLHGFRKPAPEKPKADTDASCETDLKVEISEEATINHPSSSTMSHCNNPFLMASSREIACYPITSISRPLDMFGAFPQETRTFVPVAPPAPPSRKSSRSNSTLKIMSHVKTNHYDKRTTLETTQRTVASICPRTVRKIDHYRSKSAGPQLFAATSSSSLVKEEKNQENSTRVASTKRYPSPTHQRKSSPSPVAFGRGISKERTFAEEKKRIEQKLPKVVSVSTSILRNPDLRSPNEVKKALRSSYLSHEEVSAREKYATIGSRSSLKRFSSNGTFRSASSMYSSTKSLNKCVSPVSIHKKDDRSFKVSMVSPGNRSKELPSARKAHTRGKPTVGTSPNVTIRTSFQKASKAFGLKSKTASNQSLARTNSTYSIDSTSSKRKSRVSYIPSTLTTLARGNRDVKLRGSGSNSLDRVAHLKSRISSDTKKGERFVGSSYSEHIVEQTENVRTDSFFQNLFLKSSGTSGATPEPGETSASGSVLEKTRMWNSLSCKSEPSLKPPNYYLTQARPVSSSKFRTMEYRGAKSKLAADGDRQHCPAGEMVAHMNRYESLSKLTEHEDDREQQQQFGYVRGRRMKIDYSIHERSLSEPTKSSNATGPTTTTTMTTRVIQEELVSTGAPRTIVGRRVESTTRTSRSPSCRRIQTLKGEGHVRKIVRARSLSSNERQHQQKSDQALVRTHSLNLNGESGTNVSRARFRELNSFYSSLERLGQLEYVTSCSSSDLRTRRPREEEIIDFDLWKRVREHEKAERELWQLKNKLKQDQKERDFFFLPRDPEEVRWNSDLDTGLRNREKSVEDLKCVLNQQALAFEDAKLRQLEVSKDHYKPLWRGSSVVDVANQMEEKYSLANEKKDEPQSLDSATAGKRYGVISSTLLSTLSTEQMRKLKSQLSEIYSSGGQKEPEEQEKTVSRVLMRTEERAEHEYIINVPERASRLESLLKVRSHSMLTKDQINASHLEASEHSKKTLVDMQKSFESKSAPRAINSTSTEEEAIQRATLSRSLCQELKDKILEKHHTLPSLGKNRKDRLRPTILPTEHRYHSLESGLKKIEGATVTKKPQPKTAPESAKVQPQPLCCDTESISSETSNKTVIFRTSVGSMPVPVEQDIKSKIKYFEEKQGEETPTVTVYHAREDSSPSEDEMGGRRDATDSDQRGTETAITLSQSFTDLKDLFGEKRSVSCSYTTSSKCSAPSSATPKNFTFRSRSSTPDYATCIQTGEVKKIKDKFESLDGSVWRSGRSESPSISPRQYQSDSELNRPFAEVTDLSKDKQGQVTIVRQHESGDVSRMTHKYETQSRVARCRKRKERVISPILKHPSLRKDDRFMPHINVISKTASLKREMKPTSRSSQQHSKIAKHQPHDESVNGKNPKARRSASSGSEEIEKLKSKFEMTSVENDKNLSLLGKMYTSVPDIRELKDICGYLSGEWIAHQFPKPTDNARSLTAPDQSTGTLTDKQHAVPCKLSSSSNRHQRSALPLRSNSSSPPRQNASASVFLKQLYDSRQCDDGGIGLRSKYRYVSDRQLEAEMLWRKIQAMTGSATVIPTDSFEESPRRYIESDVNIHYKTPIRFEYKEPIPDDELAYRQAEHMRRVYQEERRRKYINELEDMHSRRHADNILPSQKSPIPLNRYDDFAADLSPKPLQQQQPKTIARALYNFQGQSMRELSFRKGDIIYLRRQIDKNWYEGEHNATVGLLPANYIEILTKDNANLNAKPLPKKPTREGKARAKFNFTAQTAVELSLLKGELVTLTRRVDENWFEGKIGSKKGIFPVSYVEILTDIDGAESYEIEPIVKAATQSFSTHYGTTHSNGRVSPGIVRETKTVQKTEVLHVDTSNEPISYRALYNYKPQNTDELELHEGDIVYVLEKCDDGWYVGTSARSGCFGTFPGNYVNKL
ncbi:uncharacterized protein LOC126577765 isoform X15 [Anopheles aquasalis]|uniref:uncharacterized protein LOC126577765 isoform X15 n=1 Tax=Anopheles aquasalis TaxID=42839 RepID=UPI00215B280F|nr:uncharacterized protein LOC126577765 isoform X15 [Anopheles aquasalis]